MTILAEGRVADFDLDVRQGLADRPADYATDTASVADLFNLDRRIDDDGSRMPQRASENCTNNGCTATCASCGCSKGCDS